MRKQNSYVYCVARNFEGVYCCGLAIFCVLREQIIAMGKTDFSCRELIFGIFRKSRSNGLIAFSFFIEYVQSNYRF